MGLWNKATVSIRLKTYQLAAYDFALTPPDVAFWH
jgi:hypothetical protein